MRRGGGIRSMRNIEGTRIRVIVIMGRRCGRILIALPMGSPAT